MKTDIQLIRVLLDSIHLISKTNCSEAGTCPGLCLIPFRLEQTFKTISTEERKRMCEILKQVMPNQKGYRWPAGVRAPRKVYLIYLLEQYKSQESQRFTIEPLPNSEFDLTTDGQVVVRCKELDQYSKDEVENLILSPTTNDSMYFSITVGKGGDYHLFLESLHKVDETIFNNTFQVTGRA